METMTISNTQQAIREYQGKRVVTFRDIDTVHNRPAGTARKRFCDNRKRFCEGTDFFFVYRGESHLSVFRTLEIPPLIDNLGYLITWGCADVVKQESGIRTDIQL